MLNREVYLQGISRNLALLSREVSIRNAINLYDINIVAEDFYAGLLNVVYRFELKNANAIERNAQAIDLIDTTNRIAVQVTSDNSSEKIKHTISEFVSSRSYVLYDRLIVLILTQKKKYRTMFQTDGCFSFDKNKDILDPESLIKHIETLDVAHIKEINEYLERELREKSEEVKTTQASEVDTIIDLITYISQHKEVRKKIDVEIDPEYKIYKRFKAFADQLVTEYTTMFAFYGEALRIVNETLGTDEAQDIITTFYLQDISMVFLDEANNDPVKALGKMVCFFEDKLSQNGKKYDRAAIKFYLVNEMIKCSVFPNERGEYDVGR